MNTDNQDINLLVSNVKQLIEKHLICQAKVDALEEDLKQLEKEKDLLLKQLDQSKAENRSLKTANAMLGSTEYKRETKLKINSLIREIDQCIVQLSE